MGYLFVFAASVLFGVSPTFSTLLLKSGWTNGAVLLDSEICGAVYLFSLIRNRHLKLRIEKNEFLASFGLGGLAFWGTNMLLQISYSSFSNPGMGTVLHFTYPIFVMLLMVICFKERVTPLKVMCILASLCGIYLIANISGGLCQNRAFLTGVLSAIASGAAYAVYIIINGRSAAKNLHPLVWAFYVLTGGAAVNLLYLAASGSFYCPLSGANAIYALAMPLCSVAALVSIAAGIRKIGPTKAAIINTMEPVVSIIILVFHNTPITWSMVCGVGLILLGTGLIAALNEAPEGLRG